MFKGVKRIVVKVGSQLLSEERGINVAFIEKISSEIRELVEDGREVVLVSSGAVLAGLKALGLKRKPFSIPEKQALSAVGQPYLMAEYRKAFGRFGLKVAQVLVTAEDLRSKKRFENARNTFEELLKFGVVPIVNENDTVSVDEIKIGDNDNLSAHVSVLVDADLLVMLTVANGIYDKDPFKNPDAKLIPVVESEREILSSCDLSSKSAYGTGGMETKVKAAIKASRKGIPVVVAGGFERNVLKRILSGEKLGTLFLPKKILKAKGYRILYLMEPRGSIVIDEGAREAVENGKNLLSKGVKQVLREFEKGDIVEVLSENGDLVGKGVAKCSSKDLGKSKVCIHSNDFVLLKEVH